MSDVDIGLSYRAVELRQQFDRTFSQPRHIDTAVTEDFLAIRVESEPYAIRLSEIAGLFADKKITRVPGPIATLLGIGSFRGVIVPVYDLRALLGYPVTEAPRWLVMASAKPVALMFDAFEGHFRISPDEIVPQNAGERSRSHVRGFVHGHDRIRPIVHLATMLDAIGTPTTEAPLNEEQ
jgi:chemotaxis signal transduction protein